MPLPYFQGPIPLDPIKFPEKNGFQGLVSNRLLMAEFYPQFTLVNLWESTTEIITDRNPNGAGALDSSRGALLHPWFGPWEEFFSSRY